MEPTTDTVESVYATTDCRTPVIFLLSTGADPTEAIEVLAKKKKQSVECISMGEGQDVAALKAMHKARQAGTWVLLQNCELGLDLMAHMEKLLNTYNMRQSGRGTNGGGSGPGSSAVGGTGGSGGSGGISVGGDPAGSGGGRVSHLHTNEHFRLMMTASPHPDFPLGLLQMSTKITNEPPCGLRAGLLRSFLTTIDQDKLERIESPSWRRLLHAVAFMHTVVKERRKFGPLGWTIPYEFNAGDLSASLMFLEKHLFDGDIDWDTVRYMIAEVQYGGKITDTVDARLFNTYAGMWLTPEVVRPGFTFNPPALIQSVPEDFVYTVLDDREVGNYRRYCSSLPNVDSPEIIGLHPNADITFRRKDVAQMFATLATTSPKGGRGLSSSVSPAEAFSPHADDKTHMSHDQVVSNLANDLLGKLPSEFMEDKYLGQIRGMGGLDVPLNIFLFQEIYRLQNVLVMVRETLRNLRLAIRGEVALTDALAGVSHDIFSAQVPQTWIFTAGGEELSWVIPALGQWFASLSSRHAQYTAWLDRGRPATFWLSGFFNPQGFLTAVKQEVTRLHRADCWALDDVTYFTEVTRHMSADKVQQGPKEGVYLDGLSLEGARWDLQSHSLAESLPKVLFDAVPIVFVSAVESATKKHRTSSAGSAVVAGSMSISANGTGGGGAGLHESDVYECPCYKYRMRQDRFHVITIPLPCGGRRAGHWILRGVALLCSTF